MSETSTGSGSSRPSYSLVAIASGGCFVAAIVLLGAAVAYYAPQAIADGVKAQEADFREVAAIHRGDAWASWIAAGECIIAAILLILAGGLGRIARDHVRRHW